MNDHASKNNIKPEDLVILGKGKVAIYYVKPDKVTGIVLSEEIDEKRDEIPINLPEELHAKLQYLRTEQARSHELTILVAQVASKEKDCKWTLIYVVSHTLAPPHFIRIGGDCYRSNCHTLSEMAARTGQLAHEMKRKGAVAMPDKPEVHAGKKGEFAFFNRNNHIPITRTAPNPEEISESKAIEISAFYIPILIEWLNKKRRIDAEQQGTPVGKVLPESNSPDVFTGPNWNEYAEKFVENNSNLNAVTCIPQKMGGFTFPSSDPTGRGLSTVLIKTSEFSGVDLLSAKILVEAAGGVTYYMIKDLLEYGINSNQMTIFDPDLRRIRLLQRKFPGINALVANDTQVYNGEIKLPSNRYDIWVNNGLGDRLELEQSKWLLAKGARIFIAGANTIFSMSDTEEITKEIKSFGGVMLPGYAANGGGFSAAVIGQFLRAEGQLLNTPNAHHMVVSQVKAANIRLLDDAIKVAQETGLSIWETVERVIDRRLNGKSTNSYDLTS